MIGRGLIGLGVALCFAAMPSAVASAAPSQFTDGLTRSAHDTVSGDREIGSATAHCPGGRHAVSGGFKTPPASSSVVPLVFESRKAGDRSWRVSVQLSDPGPRDPVRLTSFVNCFRAAPRAVKRSNRQWGYNSFSFTNPIHPVGFAKCPRIGNSTRRTTAIAGGFRTELPVKSYGIRFVVTDSNRIAERPGEWGTGAFAWDSYNDAYRITTEAYCADLAAPQLEGAQSDPATNGQSSAAAACEHGGVPISGGFIGEKASVGEKISDHLGGTLAVPYESRLTRTRWVAAASRLPTPPLPNEKAALFKNGSVKAKIGCVG